MGLSGWTRVDERLAKIIGVDGKDSSFCSGRSEKIIDRHNQRSCFVIFRKMRFQKVIPK